MKWIIPLLICWSTSAQLPVVPFNPSSSSANTGPAGIGGALWYWNFTNNIQSTFVTNWIDQISGVAHKWNTTKNANTRPTNSLSGVWFDGFNFGQNLTNDVLVNTATSTLSNIWEYISFKPKAFNTGTPGITVWGASGSARGYLITSSDKIIRFDPGTPTAVTTALALDTEYDISLCVSNGLMWSWTNGIASAVAVTCAFPNGSFFDPIGLAGNRENVNWYYGYIQELAAGTNGGALGWFTSVQASNLHFWRTNVVFYSAP